MELPVRLSKQHRFTAEERWALLEEYDKCIDHGSKSAFCRTVGINTTTARDWARARDAGLLKPPGSAGRSTAYVKGGLMDKRDRAELERLKRENAALKKRLEQSEAAVDVLGKASALLESLARSAQAAQEPEVPEEQTQGRPDWLQEPGSGNS
jgi:transposase